MKRIGHQRTPLTPVDDRIDFNIGTEQKNENPVITEEYQRQHNTEILCGPIDLHRCMDLSCRSGCVTLTSPKLFRSKARTLLVHIKALIDQKDGVSNIYLSLYVIELIDENILNKSIFFFPFLP
jgi:baculoviral IAP repeat-containing protein 6